MRILLGNNDMSYRGGTQAWIKQMARTLSENHDVHLFTQNGTRVTEIPPASSQDRYDVALINHWTTSQALRKYHIGRRIFTSHGTIPHEEIPVLGADAYVAVSEAVGSHYPFRSTIIRNPIDTQHFKPTTTKNQTLKRVAFVSNRQGRARELLEEACKRKKIELRVVGKSSAVADPQPVYNWADAVVGIARVAMEALACDRNVLCFDYTGFHDWVVPENLALMRYSNFGGHVAGTWPTVNELVARLDAYDASINLRDAIEKHNDPRLIADQYVHLATHSKRSFLGCIARHGPRQLSSPKITQAAMKLRHLQ